MSLGINEGTKDWPESTTIRIEHAERIAQPEDLEAAPAEQVPERGYLDVPVRQFRLERPDDYLEPMDQLSRSIEPFQDPRETVHLINPDLETGASYQVNCADAARCFERTWRGHLEEAAGRAVHIERGVATIEKASGRTYSRSAPGLYVEGEPSERTDEWAGAPLERLSDPTALRDALERDGPGSSAIIHTWAVSPEGGPIAHAYNAVNFDGHVEIVDAQTREVLPFDAFSIYPGIGEPYEHRLAVWDSMGRRIHV